MTASRGFERPLTRRAPRVAAAAAVLAALLVACTSAASEPFVAPPVTPVADPVLIKHGWDIPTPAFIEANVRSMERLPFDGTTVTMPGLSDQVQRTTPVGYGRFRSALAPVADTRFRTLTHNFVMVYSTPAGDLFDDWSVPVANFANLARAASEAGFEGIFYDNEEYSGSALALPENCSGQSPAQCRNQARLRGSQIMTAIREEWPNARVITAYGPWLSEPTTRDNLPGVPYSDVAAANPLTGSFAAGMVEATVGTGAQVVDGGEIYTARSPAQFATVKGWQKQGMGERSVLVPTELRADWADSLSGAFGVYDRPWLGVPMDPGIWRSTLANALAATDKYVWAYTERYDWWGTGWPQERVPAEWVEATRQVRAGG